MTPSDEVEACRTNLRIFYSDYSQVIFESGTPKNHALAIATAIGAPWLLGRSVTALANEELGISKQALSKIACDFVRYTGLPPSLYMRQH